jgi:broad specificity phosphatase PhoE
MALSTEGRRASNLVREPDAALLEGWVTETRTVVFVRHGESTWNEIFNRGKGFQRFLWMPVRLVRGLAREAAAFLSPESTFLDSPLSDKGIQQAVDIREALNGASDNDNALLAEVLGTDNNTTSVIVASNLLRAVETITIALADRLAATNEKVYIRSELQEISRNLDAVSLAPPLKLPLSPRACVVQAHEGASLDYGSLYDADGNRGNKAILADPCRRLARFAAFCFGDEMVGGIPCLQDQRQGTVIAAGHSLWFRTFFRVYMDKRIQHPSKEGKISNAGVVAFKLERGAVGGRMLYRIRPESIRVLHGRFETSATELGVSSTNLD